jgi:aspartyl-tRNA(Asn)/glutamyl-tRNA(Gln) amidotransferase subunit B
MESIYDKYETVIGLEVHAQLLTRSKAYSSDPNEYGASPNTNVSPITLGHPGTLPKVNKKVVEYGIRLGLACHMDIHRNMHFARKNYFYADLPKGYQITQDKTPICTGGYITIKDSEGKEKRIGLTRAHLEEDAGKSMHDQDPYDSLIDLNRAGVPLIEIVSEPELRSSEEAYNYLAEVRKILRYLGICDGNMEEGSMRCDANVSVRLKGESKFGTRTEVKNMNSLRNVARAIEFEAKRQVDLIESGESIHQETRSYDAVNDRTFSLRSKELAHDYRYFPEPDIQPLVLSEEEIKSIESSMPPLPQELYKKYTEEFGLSEYDAGVITDNKEIALYYEDLVQHTSHYKAACNWLTGDVKSYLNANAITLDELKLEAGKLAELINLVKSGAISYSVAAQKIFPILASGDEKSPKQLAEELNLLIEHDDNELETMAREIMDQWPEKVAEYRSGKKGLLGLFMGELMKKSKGKADPKVANQLLRELLEEE